jgi:hypothetical protein
MLGDRTGITGANLAFCSASQWPLIARGAPGFNVTAGRREAGCSGQPGQRPGGRPLDRGSLHDHDMFQPIPLVVTYHAEANGFHHALFWQSAFSQKDRLSCNESVHCICSRAEPLGDPHWPLVGHRVLTVSSISFPLSLFYRQAAAFSPVHPLRAVQVASLS